MADEPRATGVWGHIVGASAAVKAMAAAAVAVIGALVAWNQYVEGREKAAAPPPEIGTAAPAPSGGHVIPAVVQPVVPTGTAVEPADCSAFERFSEGGRYWVHVASKYEIERARRWVKFVRTERCSLALRLFEQDGLASVAFGPYATKADADAALATWNRQWQAVGAKSPGFVNLGSNYGAPIPVEMSP